MRRRRAVAALLLAAAGCSRAQPTPEESAAADAQLAVGVHASTLRTVIWSDLQLRVPADADSHGTTERFDLTRRPHTRSPDTMTLRRASAEEHAVLLRGAPSKAALSGGRLAYRIDRAEGGSGGPEATLVGAVEVGGGTYRVECHAQSEDHEPAGDWCLPFLLTLEHR